MSQNTDAIQDFQELKDHKIHKSIITDLPNLQSQKDKSAKQRLWSSFEIFSVSAIKEKQNSFKSNQIIISMKINIY